MTKQPPDPLDQKILAMLDDIELMLDHLIFKENQVQYHEPNHKAYMEDIYSITPNYRTSHYYK